MSGCNITTRGCDLSTLQLNRTYSIGPRGTYIKIPYDSLIFKTVRRYGQWELAESEFLATGLKFASFKSDSGTVLIDIGAHVGLVSLQTINIAKTNADIIMFEPISTHVRAIKHNLTNLKQKVNITVNESALSDRDGKASLFIDSANYGRSSLLQS